MDRFFIFTLLFFCSFADFLSAFDSSLVKAVHQSHRAAGVFLLIEGGVYTFDFTAARDACLSLNVTMATREQMERALQHGLQTCKFGWTAEQVAVVPRLTVDEKCGQGRTGVVRWAAGLDRKFGVFCFNASDFSDTPEGSPSSPHSSTSFTTQPAVTQTSTPGSPVPTSTSRSPPPGRRMTTEASRVRTTPSSRISSSSTAPEPSSFSHLLSSAVSVTFPASAHASSTSESATQPPVSLEKPSLGDVPTALIILSIIALLLAAAGVVWYYKLNILAFWSQVQQKEDMETEMWKHVDSEMDLHSPPDGGEEEESDRKYSSDITLCVNPDIKLNSSE
ncbi:lymphatic vessel endothelial hyaluronic receptor 1b [Halichoeres trimaculatus]|uniref:lymphatic vessel endothelial hyaluronic receptor 1b n=1 Tax=Halichoeres trimaculatus TaxID=147232 RepID=UPI003D9E703F